MEQRTRRATLPLLPPYLPPLPPPPVPPLPVTPPEQLQQQQGQPYYQADAAGSAAGLRAGPTAGSAPAGDAAYPAAGFGSRAAGIGEAAAGFGSPTAGIGGAYGAYGVTSGGAANAAVGLNGPAAGFSSPVSGMGYTGGPADGVGAYGPPTFAPEGTHAAPPQLAAHPWTSQRSISFSGGDGVSSGGGASLGQRSPPGPLLGSQQPPAAYAPLPQGPSFAPIPEAPMHSAARGGAFAPMPEAPMHSAARDGAFAPMPEAPVHGAMGAWTGQGDPTTGGPPYNYFPGGQGFTPTTVPEDPVHGAMGGQGSLAAGRPPYSYDYTSGGQNFAPTAGSEVPVHGAMGLQGGIPMSYATLNQEAMAMHATRAANDMRTPYDMPAPHDPSVASASAAAMAAKRIPGVPSDGPGAYTPAFEERASGGGPRRAANVALPPMQRRPRNVTGVTWGAGVQGGTGGTGGAGGTGGVAAQPGTLTPGEQADGQMGPPGLQGAAEAGTGEQQRGGRRGGAQLSVVIPESNAPSKGGRAGKGKTPLGRSASRRGGGGAAGLNSSLKPAAPQAIKGSRLLDLGCFEREVPGAQGPPDSELPLRSRNAIFTVTWQVRG